MSTFLIKTYLAAFLVFSSTASYAEDTIRSAILSPPVAAKVQTLLETFFQDCPSDQIKLKPLTGGYSGANMFLITAGDKQYVFRIIPDRVPAFKAKKELYAMQKAADLGIAPPIYWISNDEREILMQFIDGGTLRTAAAKRAETIEKIAQTLAKVHSMPKNPYILNNDGFLEYMEGFYKFLHFTNSSSNSQLESAIAIIRAGDEALKKLESPSVTTHGDPNARNILIGNGNIYLIDWSEGMYTDPFHDLAYYSLLLSYGDKEESALLESYLNRSPNLREIERFKLAKKMNLARLAMGAMYVINEMTQKSEEQIDCTITEREWAYFANAFADNNDPQPLQFFFEMMESALNYANSI